VATSGIHGIFERGNSRDVDGKKCSQQKNSTNKLSDHYKLTIARRRRVVGESHDEETDVKSIQRGLAGWKDFRSNIQTSSATTKMPVVFLGKKRVIHECLRKKPSSSERSAASSNTMERYKSEITITIGARKRQPRKTDAIPVAETKEKITIRTMSLLVSLLIANFKCLHDCSIYYP
jgi:hypothetical protein